MKFCKSIFYQLLKYAFIVFKTLNITNTNLCYIKYAELSSIKVNIFYPSLINIEGIVYIVILKARKFSEFR